MMLLRDAEARRDGGVCPEEHDGLGEGHVYVRVDLGQRLAGDHVCGVIRGCRRRMIEILLGA